MSAQKSAGLAGLPRLLRGVGAPALLAAASSFLFQHWENGGDVWRYYALLAHTVLLGVLGFVWGLRVDDAKGARTALALAAGLVPAHFCILGALVYSQFSWDGPLSAVASYATWVAPGPVAALATGLSLCAGKARWSEVYRRAAALGLMGTTALDLLLFPGVVASLASLSAAIATLSYGFVTERRGLFFAGIGAALLATATHVRAAINLYAVSHWGSLALLGVLVILAATTVERHGPATGAWAARQRHRFGASDETEL